MKTKLLLLMLVAGTLGMNAQFTVADHNGNPIVDGGIYATGAFAEEGTLPFYVTNTSPAVINMKITFESAVNANGDLMELCFGDCYTDIVLGASYPVGYSIAIDPGHHQLSDGDHFLNRYPGNGTDVQDYVFRFHQVDGDGNEIGTPLTMTFRYDPLLAVSDVNKLDISVYPTITSGKLTIDAVENLQLSVYDLQGRLVKKGEMNIGKNQLDLSGVASQMYLLHFKNEQGQSQITKVIVN